MKNIKKDKKLLRTVPETPGVYFFKIGKEIIYIGKAINLRSRLSSYFLKNLVGKTAQMVQQATNISYILVNSELEALLLEARLVRINKPKYNIELRDDKHPLYIKITNEMYPRILTARKIDSNSDTKSFYGPFPSSTNVKTVLKLLRNLFPYSDHKLGKRACLYNQIGLCNPCPNYINQLPEGKDKNNLDKKYKANIRLAKGVLDGRIKFVVRALKTKMKDLSKQERFEEASIVRNKIESLEYITSPRVSVGNYLKNPNFIDDVRKKETDQLAKILNKFNIAVSDLGRIECYDVAHLAGSATTASMVTFINGQKEKTLYRHFRIRQIKSNSDADSMREVLDRRIKHLSDWGVPDLIVVDGGKPQVSVFFEKLKSLDIPVVGLAKKFETLIIPEVSRTGISYSEFRLPRSSALNLLQRMRDEAHRFARRYHHKLIEKELFDI